MVDLCRKEFFSKKLREPDFDVLTEDEKDFVRNVCLAESAGKTKDWELEFIFCKTLLQCVIRRIKGAV